MAAAAPPGQHWTGCEACLARGGPPTVCLEDCSRELIRTVATSKQWAIRNGVYRSLDPLQRATAGWKNGAAAGPASGRSWDLRWSDMAVTAEKLSTMRDHQITNSFPGMAFFCRKDVMARTLVESGVDSFVPRAWVLPADHAALEAHLAQAGVEAKARARARAQTAGGDREAEGRAEGFLIVKPVSGSQGRGIHLCPPEMAAVQHAARGGTKEVVVQEYLADPLLIEDRKFDLRLYVLVTSVAPLRVEVYHDGLVRLCTEKYEPPTSDNISHTKMHLANWSINKLADSRRVDGDPVIMKSAGAGDPVIITRQRRAEMVRKKQEADAELAAGKELLKNTGVDPTDGAGLKRSLTWFKRWIHETGGDWDTIERAIDSLVAKTLITAQPDLAHKYASATSSRADADEGADINDVVGGSNSGVEGGKKQRGKATSGKTSSKADGSMGGAGSIKSRCFQILGFDVMLDRKHKPWLIEINHGPSMACDSPLDSRVKRGLIASVFTRILKGWGHGCASHRDPSVDDPIPYQQGFAPWRAVLPAPAGLRTELSELQTKAQELFRRRLHSPNFAQRLRTVTAEASTDGDGSDGDGGTGDAAGGGGGSGGGSGGGGAAAARAKARAEKAAATAVEAAAAAWLQKRLQAKREEPPTSADSDADGRAVTLEGEGRGEPGRRGALAGDARGESEEVAPGSIVDAAPSATGPHRATPPDPSTDRATDRSTERAAVSATDAASRAATDAAVAEPAVPVDGMSLAVMHWTNGTLRSVLVSWRRWAKEERADRKLQLFLASKTSKLLPVDHDQPHHHQPSFSRDRERELARERERAKERETARKLEAALGAAKRNKEENRVQARAALAADEREPSAIPYGTPPSIPIPVSPVRRKGTHSGHRGLPPAQAQGQGQGQAPARAPPAEAKQRGRVRRRDQGRREQMERDVNGGHGGPRVSFDHRATSRSRSRSRSKSRSRPRMPLPGPPGGERGGANGQTPLQRYQTHKLHGHTQQRRQGNGKPRPARPREQEHQHEEPGWREELAAGNARSLDELKRQVNGRRRAGPGAPRSGAPPGPSRLEPSLNERLDTAATNHLMVDSSLELTKMLLQDIAMMGRGRVEGL